MVLWGGMGGSCFATTFMSGARALITLMELRKGQAEETGEEEELVPHVALRMRSGQAWNGHLCQVLWLAAWVGWRRTRLFWSFPGILGSGLSLPCV